MIPAPRDAWVLSTRGAKVPLDPRRPYASVWEEELDPTGALAPTAVVFLTNRECPFRCVMCDLWTHTLDETVPPGAIAEQIDLALASMPPAFAAACARGAPQVKLYNAGSFFDPHAIPPEEDDAIAQRVSAFARVIVEAHPAFLAGAAGRRAVAFRDRLAGRLEVAVGLETAHESALERLNKRMTVDAFRRAAAFLRDRDIDLRVFVLLNPPYLTGDAGVEWACRSIDLAAACGAIACSVIATRRTPALTALGADFEPPRLRALEAVVAHGIGVPGLRVFADLWDIERFADCDCAPARLARLRAMNATQTVPPPVICPCDARR